MTQAVEERQALTRVGELVVDEETGEVLDWGDIPATGRIEHLQRLHREATDQEKTWAQAKRAYGAVLGRLLDEQGMKSYASEYGRSTAVAGSTVHRAPAEKLLRAVEAELLTHDQAAAIALEAAKELDPEAVERAVTRDHTERARALLAVLIEVRERSGFVRTSPPRQAAPAVSKGVK